MIAKPLERLVLGLRPAGSAFNGGRHRLACWDSFVETFVDLSL